MPAVASPRALLPEPEGDGAHFLLGQRFHGIHPRLEQTPDILGRKVNRARIHSPGCTGPFPSSATCHTQKASELKMPTFQFIWFPGMICWDPAPFLALQPASRFRTHFLVVSLNSNTLGEPRHGSMLRGFRPGTTDLSRRSFRRCSRPSKKPKQRCYSDPASTETVLSP